MGDATDKEAAAKNQQDVGKDRAQHAGLDDADLAVLEGYDADLRSMLAQPVEYSDPLTINSTAFPKVAFRRPPSVWPSLTESSSVAKLNSDAKGMMARKFRMKMTVGGQ